MPQENNNTIEEKDSYNLEKDLSDSADENKKTKLTGIICLAILVALVIIFIIVLYLLSYFEDSIIIS